MKKSLYYLCLIIASVILFNIGCKKHDEIVIIEDEDIAKSYPPILYATGASFGWGLFPILPSESDPSIFEFEVNLTYQEADQNGLFKFQLSEAAWDVTTFWTPTEVDLTGACKEIFDGMEYPISQNSFPEGTLQNFFWGVSEVNNGKYKITVDADKMVIKVQKLSESTIGYLWADGEAFNSTLTRIESDVENSSRFVFKRLMSYSSENCLMRFQLTNESWDVAQHLIPTEVDFSDNVKIMEHGTTYPMTLSSVPNGNFKDHYWGVSQSGDGEYRFTVDLESMTMKVERLSSTNSDYPPVLYATGAAFGWGLVPILPSESDPSIFEFEVDLTYQEADQNGLFKFQLSEEAWNVTTFWTPTEVDLTGACKEIFDGGEYPISQNSFPEGTLQNFFWGVSEANNGKYKITVDADKMVIKAQKLEESTIGYLWVDGAAVGWTPTQIYANQANPSLFELSLRLTYQEADGNALIKFKLSNEGGWDEVEYLTPPEVDFTNVCKAIVSGETYDIDRNSFPAGNMKNFFWGVTEENNGMYDIEVNIETMKISFTKTGD
ncbi:MAG: hypothetical protein WCZ43_00855 [Proteiniphilum sp.]